MKSRFRASAYFSFIVLFITAGNANAVAISYSGFSATGSVELSTTIGTAPYSDGNVSQTGSIRTTNGGSTTTDGFSTTPGGTPDGVDDGTTTLPTTNPLTGALTDTGDGVGFTVDMNTGDPAGTINPFKEGYDFIAHFGIDLANNSVGDIYTVTFQLDFSHTANADGADAYADIGLDLEVDGVNVDAAISNVSSDGLLGDTFGDSSGVTNLGTFGAAVSDSDTVIFNVILNPGDSSIIDGIHQWEGGVYDGTGSFADIDLDLVITGVACSGACVVSGVPVPGAAWLFASGVSALALRRRRSCRNEGGSRTGV